MNYEGKKVIAFLDDASRYIQAIGEYEQATAKNTRHALKNAEKVAALFNGTIYVINTDRGPQFYANKKGKEGNEQSQFQKYLQFFF